MTETNVAQKSRTRIMSVDIVRGVIMILMALDHVRDYTTNLRFRPEDMAKTTPLLFATRWVTHFCAPTFFLLAGVGIGISLDRGKSPSQLSRFLVTRGIWLLILELIITPIGWQFGFDLIPAFALVLWAFGWTMMLMAIAVHVPRRVGAVVALLLICGHNLLDSVKPESFGRFAGFWNVLHVPGFAIPDKLFVAYPLIPWVAVTLLGFVLAAVYTWDAPRRRQLLVRAGAACIVAFIVLRGFNTYGNPGPWSHQRTAALTVASFLNVMKYPPSLQYLLMTLGPIFIFLAVTEQTRGRFATWLSVYGRVPLFFYVTHIFVMHAIAVGIAYVQTGQLHQIAVISAPDKIPATYGVSLAGVYLAWLTTVVVLYYPCRQFARRKDAGGAWWLSYL